MNRAEFMRQLEQLLQNITPAEREEALQYYNDYFDDAGAENEQDVIEALGSPAKVAENLKRDLNGSNSEHVQYGAEASDRAMIEYGKTEQAKADFAGSIHDEPTKSAPVKKSMPTWAVVLITICVVFASPLLLGLAVALLGLAIAAVAVLAGVLIAWFAIIFSVAVAAISLFIVFGVLCGVGIRCLVIQPMAGIALIGVGLICGGVGILFLMLTVLLAGVVTPAIFKGIGRLFGRKKKES